MTSFSVIRGSRPPSDPAHGRDHQTVRPSHGDCDRECRHRRNQPRNRRISELFPDIGPINLTSSNAWEDADFVAAVRGTGRKKLIMTALMEVRLVHPALDALQEGFEVQLIYEVQRDWNRAATEPILSDILFAVEGH